MFTKIKEIYLNNINGDVSKHVKALLRHKNLNHIEIDKCTMKEATTMESSSENIVVLIIRDCILSQEALKGIAASILSKKREKLCVFGLQGFMNSDQSLLYMNTLLEISPQPNIIEFDFHGFSIDQNSVNSFIEFLKTQTNLLYLGVRACFRKNTNVTLPLLADFIVKSRLSGIDISSDKLRGTPQSYVSFINSLTNCKSLTSISFMNTRLGDSGAQSIIKLAHELPSLEEISLDNIDLPSKTSFINLYSRLLEIASLRSIQTPKNDIQRLDLSNDSLPSLKKKLLPLKRMNSPKTFNARIQVYERNDFLYSEFSFIRTLSNQKLKVKEASEIELGSKLDELNNIMNTMITTIEDGFGKDPFNISMEILDTLQTGAKIPEDKSLYQLGNIISSINQDTADDFLI